MIDKHLITVIETLAFNGKSPAEIMKEIKQWSCDHGFEDANDRRYHPKPQDVHNILKAYRK